MLGVERCATRRVRRNGRGLAHFIGHRQLGAQLPGLTGNGGTVLTSGHRRAQFFDARYQLGAFRLGRQVRHQTLQHPKKLNLLAVFRGVHHLARVHGRRVISTDVVQQMQGLGRALGRRGQQVEAARHQRRQHQPGEKTVGGSHE